MDTLHAGFHLFRVGLGVESPATVDDSSVSLGLLHEMFERQATARPGALAVSCGTEQLTYAQLERRANQLARHLHNQGIGRGDCVGVWLPRSADVYVTLLGILKAGAAYVPLDPDYPVERARFILADCQARALVTSSALGTKARDLERQFELSISQRKRVQSPKPPGEGTAPKLVALDQIEDLLFSLSGESLNDAQRGGCTPSDLCYVIYTSGTTGRPKGVEIEHRSACHLVRTEAGLFQVRPADRIYQGFSLAFDASVEEIWLAFFAGATLVAGTAEMVHAGPDLPRLLTEAGVTVLSCVPTLLAMMEQELPTVRLLILGGEACSRDLVKRWWRPGRRLFNTYGPTEATVIATCVECDPAKPVTIGRLLPGYSAVLLDEQLRPVTPGQAGELCLGGIGLARGYLGRSELTLEKFLPPGRVAAERLYRTGDLARWTPEGELEFLGRIDAQVKIRGFRVELAEIEAVLMEFSNVKAAAVALREEPGCSPQLVAYVVARDLGRVEETELRSCMRARLPAYMVPSLVETLLELPTLPSGKVDRKSLPPPRARASEPGNQSTTPSTARERQLLSVWQSLFAPLPVSLADDFFLDLGGHSLLAARMVSELRKTPAFAGLSVLDVYQHPSIRALAGYLERGTRVSPEPKKRPDVGIPFWRHFWCGIAQMVSLVFILSFFALQWLAPYLTFTVLVEEEYDLVPAVLGAFASLILIYPVMLAIPVIVKWLVIGKYRPGTYPLWGQYYFRFWFVTTIEAAVPVGYLAGTPLLNIYLRLMGARIGPNVHLDSDNFAIYDLLSVGEDSSVNVDSSLLGYSVEAGRLRVGRITVGKRAFVGARAALCPDSELQDDAMLEDLSMLPDGTTIPFGESWAGSPAQRREGVEPGGENTAHQPAAAGDSVSRPSSLRRLTFGLLHAIGLLIFPVLVVAPLFPGIVVMNHLNYIDPYYWYLFLSPLVALSFVLLLCLEIAAIKWLLLGRVKPGRYRLFSAYYLRKWFVNQTMDLSLDILGPLYASIYLAPWYKLLGARLGKGAEISTASFISPDLLSIGEESFIADSVSLGAPRVRGGVFEIGPNQIGKRSFIGNSALLPPGAAVGDSVLIGCLSLPPSCAREALREDSAWLGSPSFFLPQRPKSIAFGEETTYHPPARLRALRAALEFIRVITPSTGFIVLLSLMFSALLMLRDYFSLFETLLFFPFLYTGCALAAAFLTILTKWALVGRYRPGEKPLWSTFVWRNELINALHEHLAEPFLVGALTGTPFVCWYFRLLGARIGRRVYMETTDFTEFDLAQIGDECELNADCTIQTHLFEDRIMKMSTIELAPRCTVGAMALVLYDTRMEEGSSLSDLSLLMKGETLPPGTSWEGIPARPVARPNDQARSRPR